MSKNVFRTEIINLDEKAAVKHMKENLHQDNLAGITFFCSDKYDLDLLTTELKAAFEASQLPLAVFLQIQTFFD